VGSPRTSPRRALAALRRGARVAPALFSALVLAGLGGCFGGSPLVPDFRLTATLWTSTSAEYVASTLQTYDAATEALGFALAHPQWTACLEQEPPYAHLPPAIIVDVDETVLDTTEFQARLVREGRHFDEETWEEWVHEASAEAIPGAREFLLYARSRGVEVFYITNRESDVELPTRRNLAALGLPLSSDIDTLLTKDERGWGSSKSARRRAVADTHRVLLVVGDDLADFTPARTLPFQERKALALRYREMWGHKWFLVPNPIYGSWERAALPEGATD